MSRFYDALKQASRLHQAVNERTSEEAAPAFSFESFSATMPGPSPARPAAPPVAPATAATPALASVSENHLAASVATAAAATATPAEASELLVHCNERAGAEADASVETPEQVEKLPRSPDIGTTTKVSIDKKARVIPNIADHVVVEHYRRLRTKLMQQNEADPFRTLLVTSANPQEGKTVTALNLALSFSMLPSFRVAVVDGDLRRGSLGQWVGMDQRPGLSDAIEGTVPLPDVIFKSNDVPVHFVLRGTSKKPAAELLHSPQLATQMESLTRRFDLIIIDSPPINLITDAYVLAANCDAVLLVARAFSTTCKSFEKAAQELAGRRIVGAVLNGGTQAQIYRRYNGYYY
jgi:capsular exopolysaccharide synthesis family protein